MTTSISPAFPYSGKGTLSILFNVPLPIPDQVVLRHRFAARLGFSDDTVETFIVYGDIEKGPFQLAAHDGVPMGVEPGVEYPVQGPGPGPPFNCQHLQRSTAFATIQLDQSKGSQFGPAFNCNNQGVLGVQYPVFWSDNANLFISDRTAAQNVYNVAFAFKQTVPGLSVIQQKGGPGLDLSYVDLTNADLSGVNLVGANLDHANLTGAKLIGTKLGGAVLSNATLSGANLTQAVLDGADISGAKLDGTTLSTDLTKVIVKTPPVFSTDPGHLTSFKNAKLNHSLIGLNWSCLDLTGASVIGMPADLTGLKAAHLTAIGIDLSGKKLGNAVFTDATLTGAILTGATLDGADLSGTKLQGATLSTDLTKVIIKAPPVFSNDPNHLTSFKDGKLNYSLIGLNWSCLDLTSATIVGLPQDLTLLKATHLTAAGINLSQKTLVEADFSHAKLPNAVFTASVLTNAVLTGVDLSGAKLQALTQLGGAHLDMADLTGADFTAAQLTGAKGVAATLTYAILDNAVFDSAELKGVDFSGATLIETSMQNTTSLERARFAGAYLNSVKFQNSIHLQGVNFQNAFLVNCKLTQANMGPSDDTAATLEGAFLQGANFSGVTLTNANLSGAVVSFGPGRVNVSYCDRTHDKTTPFPISYPSPTTGLQTAVAAGNCLCPNGNSYNNNIGAGLTFQQMCDIGTVPTSWTPNRCKP